MSTPSAVHCRANVRPVCDQVPFVADPLHETAQHFGVAQILFLRGCRHHEMLFHQPGHQVGIGLGQAVGFAESQGIGFTQLGMIAAAPLGDVVKQRPEIEQFGFVELADQTAAQREFVGQFRHCKTAHVAHHLEDVFVHRIDMIEVMLHLAGDAAERGDVAAENVELVHAPQLADHPCRAAQDVHEQCLHARVATCRRIDAPPRAP
jgi:hypothetical protein